MSEMTEATATVATAVTAENTENLEPANPAEAAEPAAEKWVSMEEAAEYLDVKLSTIREWIRRDVKIPRNKIGKQWKFKKSELNEWVKSGGSAMG